MCDQEYPLSRTAIKHAAIPIGDCISVQIALCLVPVPKSKTKSFRQSDIDKKSRVNGIAGKLIGVIELPYFAE